MGCPLDREFDLGEWGASLLKRLAGRRSPLHGTFEITARCNLRCVHCYVRQPPGGAAAAGELSGPQVCALLDQAVDAGCLFLLLTGGEALVRPDFLDIYRHAKRKGMLVSIFTNGVLLTEEIADVLAEWRPHGLEITLYGSSRETYERVTRVPGSYARCRAGIERAVQRGLPLNLKTVVLKANRHELQGMKDYARAIGVPFRYGALVWPRLDGHRGPCSQQLPVDEVAALDSGDEERRQAWLDLISRSGSGAGFPRAEYVYSCAAGWRSFHVDSTGRLSICLMSRRPSYDLLRGTFGEGWEQLGELALRRRTLDVACRRCTLGALCDQCPGWSQLVHGDDETPVEFLCTLAQQRAAQLAWAVT